jgi:phospholipid/cholesterol/gamma-HCH transport system substrate-binding protein
MDYKSSEIKAGIFIFISVVIFFSFLAAIVGMNSFTEKEEYRIRFHYVGGIEKGSAVRYAGLHVGAVLEVRLTDDGFPGAEVVVEVEKSTPIRQDSKAYMTTIGLMGSTYIEITSGSPETPLLPSGALIISDDIPGIAQISGAATDAAAELTELLRRLNMVFDDNNRNRISEMITSMNSIAKVTEENFQITLENLNDLIAEFNEMTVVAKNVIVENDTSFANSVRHLESLLAQSANTLTSVNGVLSEVDRSIFENQHQYNQIMDNLNSMTENINDFSQTIKERPWTIVRKTVPPARELE